MEKFEERFPVEIYIESWKGSYVRAKERVTKGGKRKRGITVHEYSLEEWTDLH